MYQPELGLKISELRQQKGLTQEQLAEHCEVSQRTIQRIENGEVDPRLYTLQCLSNVLEFNFVGRQTGNENLWLTLMHLSSTFCLFIVPLLVWSSKKDQSPRIDRQGRQILNFQVTMTLVLFAALFVLLLVSGALSLLSEAGLLMPEDDPVFILITMGVTVPFVVLAVFCLYQGVANAMRALAEKTVHYYLSIPFIK